MTAAIVSLALIAVGVVVLIALLTRPRLYARLGGRRRGADPWGDWMRRHRLSAGEAGDISTGLTRGLQHTDPRLRAAAVDWAGTTLRTEFSGRATALLLGAHLCLVVGAAVRTPGDVDWVFLAIWAAFCLVILRRRRRVQRSLEINQD